MSKTRGRKEFKKDTSRRVAKTQKSTIRTRLWVPFCMGMAAVVLPSLALVIVKAMPGANDTCYISSSPCMALYILSIVCTPTILYGVSLAITGLYHIAVILKRGEQSNTHPFLWSLAIFVFLALLAYLILGISWSFLIPNQA